MRLCSYCVSRPMPPFCAPFPCYIFPRWRRPRPHAVPPHGYTLPRNDKMSWQKRRVSPSPSSPSHLARAHLAVAMGIGPSRTGVRQGAVAGLFECPVGRICPQVVSAKESSRSLLPRPGAGDHLRPAGKREAAEGGRAKSKRGERACFHRSVSPSRRLSSRSRLRHLITCGIPSRLVMLSSRSSSRHRLVACLLIPFHPGSVSPVRLVCSSRCASRCLTPHRLSRFIVVYLVPIASRYCLYPCSHRLRYCVSYRAPFGISLCPV